MQDTEHAGLDELEALEDELALANQFGLHRAKEEPRRAGHLWRQALGGGGPPGYRVLARPREVLTVPLRAGDLLVRRALGEPGLAQVSIVVDGDLVSLAGLSAADLEGERGRRGMFVHVAERGGIRPRRMVDRFAREATGPDGRLPADLLLLRPIGSGTAVEAEADSEAAERGPVDCTRYATDCVDYPPGYKERCIRRRGTSEGECLDRTEGDDPVANLSLQLRDYDVNAYLAGEKTKHSIALRLLTDFIQKRVALGADVAVTVTGSASHTGTKDYNDKLSCRRANCVVAALRRDLTADALKRTTFDPSGKGYLGAKCRGSDCELPGYRSVLVSVHAPGLPPPPKPPEPPGWDRYCIRCCSFHSAFVVEALVDDLLQKLPDWIPKELRSTIVNKMAEKLRGLLKRLLKRAPKLGEAARGLGELAKFMPIEITRQTAVFQLKERDKPGPATVTLCYSGIGGRLALPLGEKLDEAIDKWLDKIPRLPDALRKQLRDLIKDELRSVLPDKVRTYLQPLDTDLPGPWVPFDLNRKATPDVFKGDAEVFLDAFSPGRLRLAFAGFHWRRLDDIGRRTRMVNCTDCTEAMIGMQVGDGFGFDLLSVNAGSLASSGCVCAAAAPAQVRRAFPALHPAF